jgi:hypothetical protein
MPRQHATDPQIPDPQVEYANLNILVRPTDYGGATVEPNRLDLIGRQLGEPRYASWEERESDADYRQRLLRTLADRPRGYGIGVNGRWEREPVERMHREVLALEAEFEQQLYYDWREVVRQSAPPPPEPVRLSVWAHILEDE